MKRASVSTHEQLSPTSQRNQFADCDLQCKGRSSTRVGRFPCQILLARAIVNNRPQTALCECARHHPVSLSRPALGTPTCARIENREIADSHLRQPLLNSLLGFGIARKLDMWHGEALA